MCRPSQRLPYQRSRAVEASSALRFRFAGSAPTVGASRVAALINALVTVPATLSRRIANSRVARERRCASSEEAAAACCGAGLHSRGRGLGLGQGCFHKLQVRCALGLELLETIFRGFELGLQLVEERRVLGLVC
jgi:hypothetical protein